VFGQPGAGKTTLMRAICERSQLFYEADAPIKHRCLTGPHEIAVSTVGLNAPRNRLLTNGMLASRKGSVTMWIMETDTTRIM
jgi:GTPase SAR1 family protein